MGVTPETIATYPWCGDCRPWTPHGLNCSPARATDAAHEAALRARPGADEGGLSLDRRLLGLRTRPDDEVRRVAEHHQGHRCAGQVSRRQLQALGGGTPPAGPSS